MCKVGTLFVVAAKMISQVKLALCLDVNDSVVKHWADVTILLCSSRLWCFAFHGWVGKPAQRNRSMCGCTCRTGALRESSYAEG